jgi:hypothetical protein
VNEEDDKVHFMVRHLEERLFDQVGQVTQLESTVCDLGHRIEQGLAKNRSDQIQIESTRLQVEDQAGWTRVQIDNLRLQTEAAIDDLYRKMDDLESSVMNAIESLTVAPVPDPVSAAPAPAPPAAGCGSGRQLRFAYDYAHHSGAILNFVLSAA